MAQVVSTCIALMDVPTYLMDVLLVLCTAAPAYLMMDASFIVLVDGTCGIYIA